jgi:hypothetical protein
MGGQEIEPVTGTLGPSKSFLYKRRLIVVGGDIGKGMGGGVG